MSNIRDSINSVIHFCIDYIGLCSAKQDRAWCVLNKVWSEEAGDVQQESSGLPFDYGLDSCPGSPVLPQSHGWCTPFCCAVSKLGSNCLWVFVCTQFIKAILMHLCHPRMSVVSYLMLYSLTFSLLSPYVMFTCHHITYVVPRYLPHIPYFLAHKMHFFFPRKMWPKFDLHLMRWG